MIFQIIGTTNYLAPPKSFDPDASLETVDLNEDDSGLEKFLSEDLLYDVSPLPRDDDDNQLYPNILTKSGSKETLHNELQSLEESALYQTATTSAISRIDLSDDERDVDENCSSGHVPSNLESGYVQNETNDISKSESLYYTPDATIERLSDLEIT